MCELAHGSGQFEGQDLVVGHAPPIEPLKRSKLAGFETAELSVDVWNLGTPLFLPQAWKCYFATGTGSSVANASPSNAIVLPARRASRPAAAIIAALSVQYRNGGMLSRI